MLLLLLGVHLFFLYYVFTRISMFSALLCVVIPFYALYLFYRDWYLLRGFFFVELALVGVIIFLS